MGLILYYTCGDYGYNRTGDGVVISKYSGEASMLEIPAKTDGLPVKDIGYFAFSGYSSLTSITIPKSVTSIGESAFFWYGSLKDV